MDDLQIKAIALNAASVRCAGIGREYCQKTAEDCVIMASYFEKYLKGEITDVGFYND